MAEAFVARSMRLHERLEQAQRRTDGFIIADISPLQELLREAEACHELYEQFDDGVLAPVTESKREKRRIAGLSIDPAPSRIKLRAWCDLKDARITLAQAYEQQGHHWAANPLFHQLVDQTLRMRTETWADNVSTVHLFMFFLASNYLGLERYEEAAQWFQRTLHFCQREDPESDLVPDIVHALDALTGNKAGPSGVGSGDSSTSSSKSWKQCWTCGAAETKSQKLMRCSKCLSNNVATPAYYCSRKCQEEDWVRHKEYHRKLKNEHKVFAFRGPTEPGRRFRESADEYNQLLLQSHQAQLGGNEKKARRLLEKAIKINPESPSV